MWGLTGLHSSLEFERFRAHISTRGLAVLSAFVASNKCRDYLKIGHDQSLQFLFLSLKILSFDAIQSMLLKMSINKPHNK